jgi:two-component system chemotaxis response regulator CheY
VKRTPPFALRNQHHINDAAPQRKTGCSGPERRADNGISGEWMMARLILTVDDSPSMRLVMQLTLADQGYKVLTDVNMPRMDGITLTRELRKLPAYKGTPILILTTEHTQDKKLLGKEAGATGWLVKPFDAEQLLATIGRVL